MLKAVEAMLKDYGLVNMPSVLVGLSGGADSVALTYILHKLSQKYGFRVYTAHLNHGLRGEDADRDEKFCQEFSKSLGITHFKRCVNIGAMSQETGESEEVCGRRARYNFYNEIMEKEGILYTATAHHKNDNAETIIMNFLRGSGSLGLRGIPYVRDRFIRPLLGVTRREIEEFCKSEGLEFVTDKTNAETKYNRNKIRNLLIPQLEREYNTNLVDVITQNGEIMSVENDYMDTVAESEFQKICNNAIEITRLGELHTAIAMRVVRKMIEKVTGLRDISARHIKEILSLADLGETGKSISIKDDIVARVEYGKLVISRDLGECEDFSYELKVGENMFISELGYYVTVEPTKEIKEKGKWVSYIELPQGECEIVIRNRREGDVFNPKGMKGTKKVKDYMINEKFPRHSRSRTGIVTINGDIAWIVGHREDGRFEFNGNGIKISISY